MFQSAKHKLHSKTRGSNMNHGPKVTTVTRMAHTLKRFNIGELRTWSRSNLPKVQRLAWLTHMKQKRCKRSRSKAARPGTRVFFRGRRTQKQGRQPPPTLQPAFRGVGPRRLILAKAAKTSTSRRGIEKKNGGKPNRSAMFHSWDSLVLVWHPRRDWLWLRSPNGNEDGTVISWLALG